MSEQTDTWEEQIAACWDRADGMEPEALLREIDRIAMERPEGDAAAAYERGSARDSSGNAPEAEPFYRAALASADLDPVRRPQAVIQLASTLRILGKLDESEHLLRAELARAAGSMDANALPDQTRAFLAFTLIAQGKATEGAAHALLALAPHVTRYRRSIIGNAEELLETAAS
ncbi:MAG: hypothetical protein NVS9B12_08880 [Vulcanimicrobiaceae bacterium]